MSKAEPSTKGNDYHPLDLESLGDHLQSHQESFSKRSIVATSRLTLAILILITTALLYFRYPLQPMSTSISPPSNPLNGWHSRLHPFEGTFTPTREALVFVQFRNSKVEPEGLTTALFAPNVVVDAQGVVSTLSTEDWEGLKILSQRAVREPPQTGTFRNQWRVQQPRTGLPIDWLRVATSQDGGFEEVSVYGFDGTTSPLAEPVAGYTTLPQVLADFFGVMREARDGYKRGDANQNVLEGIKAVLPDV